MWFALVTVNGLVFGIRFSNYWRLHAQLQQHGPNVATAIARASAATIYCNFILIVLSMMRVAISRVKYFRLAMWLGLDRHVRMHKMCGNAAFIGAIVHTTAHVCASPDSWKDAVALSITACFLVLWICAQDCIRKRKR